MAGSNGMTSTPSYAASLRAGFVRTNETSTANASSNYFSQQTHNPYEQAETLDDLRDGLHVVRTLLKMGRFQEAYDAYRGDLSNALFFNLEAYAESLSLLQPFFRNGWGTLPSAVDEDYGSYLTNDAALILDYSDQPKEALAAHGAALLAYLKNKKFKYVSTTLRNISSNLTTQNLLSKVERVLLTIQDLAVLTDADEHLFIYRLLRFASFFITGRWADAEAIWNLLDPMGPRLGA